MANMTKALILLTLFVTFTFAALPTVENQVKKDIPVVYTNKAATNLQEGKDEIHSSILAPREYSFN